MNLFSLVCFILIIVMMVQILRQSAANKKISKVVEVIRKIDDEQAFMTAVEESITASKSEMEKTKYDVLKCWGLTTYGHYDEYDAFVNTFDLKNLFGDKNNPNDDSLFYMVLAIPNIMGKDHEMARADALLAKVKKEVPDAERRLDYQIGVACVDAYFDRNDKGVGFFEKVMDGDYGDYDYAKNLISLYKEVVATMLYKYYSLRGEDEKAADVLDLAESYQETRIGDTWIHNIGLTLPSSDEEDENDEAGETSDETENETAEDTDTASDQAEEKAEETPAEHNEEETDDGMSATGNSFVDDKETKE